MHFWPCQRWTKPSLWLRRATLVLTLHSLLSCPGLSVLHSLPAARNLFKLGKKMWNGIKKTPKKSHHMSKWSLTAWWMLQVHHYEGTPKKMACACYSFTEAQQTPVCRIQEGDAQLFRLDAFYIRLKMTKSQLDRLCSRSKLHAPPCTLNNSISYSASSLLSNTRHWILQRKEIARKYSGQDALTERNFTSHPRADLILSLRKNWDLPRPQLGNSGIGEWSQHRRGTAQAGIIFLNNTDRLCVHWRSKQSLPKYSEGPFT